MMWPIPEMCWGPGSGCDNLVSKPLCQSVLVCRQGRRASKAGALKGVMCLICTCSPPYSTRPLGSSMASSSIETPKLSEFA
ncbi:hypothetical protein DVH24_000101 [Malus domestica]|uniref:Uncharacterized protein n=1 Tax=Malus domestica TaxID=3750 RepID=A0A498J3L4_MALDO|nr:hypothetical protein DVH24_000101 [Malus domestica]